MAYILIASGVSLLIGFSLGVLAMGLVKMADLPAPDARHVRPIRQERDIPLRQGHGDQADADQSEPPRFIIHNPTSPGTGATVTHPAASISAMPLTSPSPRG